MAVSSVVPVPLQKPDYEVELCRAGPYSLIALPYSNPIQRAIANSLDGERLLRVAGLLKNSSTREVIRSYFAANGSAFLGMRQPWTCQTNGASLFPSLGETLYPRFPAPRGDDSKLVFLLAEAIKTGRIIVRGPSTHGLTVSALTSMTFVGESFLYGHEVQKGVSNKLHWPGGNSGVTLGPGYDMGSRSENAIIADLLSIGVNKKTAESVAKAQSLTGSYANKFVSDNINIIELTDFQQKLLMKICISSYVQRTAACIPSIVSRQLFDHEFDALVSYVYNSWSFSASLLVSLSSGDFRNPNMYRRGPPQSRVFDEQILFIQGIYLQGASS